MRFNKRGFMLIFLFLIASFSLVSAAVIRVGPGEQHTTMASAYAAANPGDTIEIEAGTYLNDQAFLSITKDDLTFRGVNGKPEMLSDVASVPGHVAIWHIDGANNILIENVKFSGARSRDDNGAAVAGKGSTGDVTLRDVVIENCQHGIFYSGDGDIIIEDSFVNDNGQPPRVGYAHSLYVGRGQKAILKGNHFTNVANGGNNLKFRNPEVYLLYNKITDDGPGYFGRASRQVDVAEAGKYWAIGNVFQQGPQAQHSSLWGGSQSGSGNNWCIEYNTFINDRSGGTFIDLRGGTATVENNIFVGPGTRLSGGGSMSNNIDGDKSWFVGEFDYRLVDNIPAIDAGLPAGICNGEDMTPVEEYLEVARRQTRVVTGNALDLGAFEYSGGTPPPSPVCGNNVVEVGEQCDGNSRACVVNGYSGSESCNAQCDGFNICVTTEFCGDGVVNGNEACDDGNNVDGDGCDVNCMVEVTPPPPPPTGTCDEDINGDGAVNIFDLAMVGGQFGQAGTGLSGDANGDGVVNILDLSLIASKFGQTCEQPPPPPPPTGEPITLEAEDFSLDSQYQTESNGVYSNDAGIRLTSGSTVGIATTTFTGSSGIYDVDVYVVEEDDGNAVLDIDIGTGFTRTINYGLSPSGFQLATVTFNDVTINNGDVITLTGTKIGSTFSRADKVVVTETSCVDGSVMECGSDTGACSKGTKTCSNGQYGACVGETGPSTEVCGNGIDEDCDGADQVCYCSSCGAGILNICDEAECNTLASADGGNCHFDSGSCYECSAISCEDFSVADCGANNCGLNCNVENNVCVTQSVGETPANFKVAFMGDTGAGSTFEDVLDLIANEGSQALIMLGDYRYGQGNIAEYIGFMNLHLGSDFAYLMTPGDHDLGDWDKAGGFRELNEQRFNQLGISWVGSLGTKSYTDDIIPGVRVFSVSPGYIDSNHGDFILQNSDGPNKKITHSGNNYDMVNGEDKRGDSQELVYPNLEAVIDIGGIWVAGDSHAYSRSDVISQLHTSDFSQVVVADSTDPFTLKLGQGIFFNAGTGGRTLRSADSTAPYLNALYGDGQPNGALFLIFNPGGNNPDRIDGYFKNVNGNIIDTFTLLVEQGSIPTSGTNGYMLATNHGSTEFEHTETNHLFYTNNKWWMAAQDNTGDWVLWENNLATPSNPGDAGGWSKALAMGGGNVNLDARSSAKMDVHWDEVNDKLHTLSQHSTPFYNVWDYNAGTNMWMNEIVNKDTGTGSLTSRAALVVDSNNVAWIVYMKSGNVLSRRYDSVAGSFSDGGIIETGAVSSEGSSRVNAINWIDDNADPAIGVAYSKTASPRSWRWAYREDSAPFSSASWIKETIDSGTPVDDHVGVGAMVRIGDTISTVAVTGKDNGDNLWAWVRDPITGWSAPVLAAGTGTRPKIVVDESNEEFYVVYGGASGVGSVDSIDFVKSKFSPVSFSQVMVGLRKGSGSGGDFDTSTVPAHNVDANMDLMIAANGPSNGGVSSGPWWTRHGIQASCVASAEVCDGQDNDCDNLVDEGGVCGSSGTITPVCASSNGAGAADDPAFVLRAKSANVQEDYLLSAHKGGEITVDRLSDCSPVTSVSYSSTINNVDANVVNINGEDVYLAVVTQRGANKLGFIGAPSFTKIGESDTFRDQPMGIAIYIGDHGPGPHVAVSHKRDGQIDIYRLGGSATSVTATYVTSLGNFGSEVEALFVDNDENKLYLSHEAGAVNVYSLADPANPSFITRFAESGISGDREGNAVFACGSDRYAVVSSQGSNDFKVYDVNNNYNFVGTFEVDNVRNTDGIDVTREAVDGLPNGVFAAQHADTDIKVVDLDDVVTALGLTSCF